MKQSRFRFLNNYYEKGVGLLKKVLLFFAILLLSACTEEVTSQPEKEQQTADNNVSVSQQVKDNLQAIDVIQEALAKRQKVESLQGHMLLEDYLEIDFASGMSTMLLSSTVDMQATNTPYNTLYLMNTRQELDGEISDDATYVYLNEDEGQIYNLETNKWQPLPKENIKNFHNIAREDLDVTRHLQEMLPHIKQVDLKENGDYFTIIFDVANKMDEAYLQNESPITQGIWKYIDQSNINMQSINYTEALYEMKINKNTFDVESLNIFVKIEAMSVNGEEVKHSASNQSQFSSFNELQQIDLPEDAWQQ